MTRRIERGQIRLLVLDLESGKLLQTPDPDRDWVKIKEKKTVLDTQAINAASVTGKMTTTAGEMIELGTMDVGAPAGQTLIQMVKEWGGPWVCVIDHDEPGAKALKDHVHEAMPLTPEQILKLYDETMQKILKVVNDNNPRIGVGPTGSGSKKN